MFFLYLNIFNIFTKKFKFNFISNFFDLEKLFSINPIFKYNRSFLNIFRKYINVILFIMKLNLNKLRTLIELSFEMKILEDLRSQ